MTSLEKITQERDALLTLCGGSSSVADAHSWMDAEWQLEKQERENLRTALRLCVREIEQFHSHAYPECKGECPAHAAMNGAYDLIGKPAAAQAEANATKLQP